MSFTATILGSSGTYETCDRAASGYLVDIDGRHVWMDAGGGTWRNLLACIEHAQVDAVILSHRHPDHVIDIFQAFHARHYGSSEPMSPIPLWAPQDVLERLAGFASNIAESFDVSSVAAGDSREFAGATFSFVGMAHPVETVGVRIEHEDKVLAYSADTGPAADLDSLARGADLFLCEATLQDADGGWDGHLTASQAAHAAEDAGARRLILTHLPPLKDAALSLSEARAAAPDLRVDLAVDRAKLEVSS